MNTPFQGDTENPLSEEITRDYRIVRPLDKGGMGDVYLAEQLRVGRRRVALKVLNRACSENPEIVRRFENEASSAGRINHRNVVTVYESRVTDDGQMYVAMEFIEGISLGRLLKEQGALPLGQVLEIARQISLGLTAAHKLGIVHRDIKPDNIMLAVEDGELVVKVLDFGIARLSETEAQGRTRAGIIIGTPAYMSAEQAMGKTGDKIDERSDIYSLAMVVYQMLAGRPAFDGKTPMEVFRKHITEPPLPPGHWRPGANIPASVEAALLRALEKRREQRQQTSAQFMNELSADAAPAGASVESLIELIARSTKGTTVPMVAESLSPIAEKDVPTERIGTIGELATSPLSSETTNPPASRVTRQNRSPQSQEARPDQQLRDSEPQAAIGVKQPDAAVRPVNDIVYLPSAGHHKKNLLIGALLLVVLAAGLYVVVQMMTSGQTSAHRVIEFRIRRAMPEPDLDTLGADNHIKAGERLGFEVKLVTPGSVYLFQQPREVTDAPWQWLNPSEDATAQTLQVGEWHTFPNGSWLAPDYQAGLRKYLMVFIPNGVNWPPAERLRSLSSEAKEGIVQLPGEVAASITGSLTGNTPVLTATDSREGRTVSFGLAQTGNDKRPAIYDMTVTQTP